MPIYNEGSIIEDNVTRMRHSLDKLELDYEVVLCDDHSSDGTEKQASKVSCDTVSYLRFSERLGKGGTFKNAMKVCRGNAVILLDADAPVSHHEFARAVTLFESGYKLIVGVRRSRPFLPVRRRILSLGFNKTINLLFKTGIMDHQCGFKIVEKSAAKTLFSAIRSDHFLFDSELIVNARILKLPIGFLELDWLENRENGDSKISSPRTVLTMLIELLLLRLSLFGNKRLLRLAQTDAGSFQVSRTGSILPAETTTTLTNHPRLLGMLRRLYLCVAFRT